MLLIIAGAAAGFFLLTAPPVPLSLEQQLDRLADYDGTAEARKLLAARKYGEAKILCQDILENDLPGRRAARMIIHICNNQLYPVEKRLFRMAEAFATGHPGDSIEEAGSAMLSDMLMYGDIRDLILQGYYRFTGKETDPYIAAFAAAGLATEFFDAADWMPALFKALRRAGALSDKLASVIIVSVKNSRNISGNGVLIFRQVGNVFKYSGFIRSKHIFKYLRHADDVAAAAKITEKSASSAHLLSRSAGSRTAEVFKKLSHGKHDKSLIRKLLTKGPGGVTLFLRFSKSVKKGNFEIFVQRVAALLKNIFGWAVWLIPPVLIGIGVLLNLKFFLKLKKIFLRIGVLLKRIFYSLFLRRV
jgi:hypothetical protein